MRKEEYKAIVLRGLDCAHLNGLISSYDYWKAIDTTQNRIQVYPEESREINEAVEIADEGGGEAMMSDETPTIDQLRTNQRNKMKTKKTTKKSAKKTATSIIGTNVRVETQLLDGWLQMNLGRMLKPEVIAGEEKIVLDNACFVKDTGRRSEFMAGTFGDACEIEVYPPSVKLYLPANGAILASWPHPLPTVTK